MSVGFKVQARVILPPTEVSKGRHFPFHSRLGQAPGTFWSRVEKIPIVPTGVKLQL